MVIFTFVAIITMQARWGKAFATWWLGSTIQAYVTPPSGSIVTQGTSTLINIPARDWDDWTNEAILEPGAWDSISISVDGSAISSLSGPDGDGWYRGSYVFNNTSTPGVVSIPIVVDDTGVRFDDTPHPIDYTLNIVTPTPSPTPTNTPTRTPTPTCIWITATPEPTKTYTSTLTPNDTCTPEPMLSGENTWTLTTSPTKTPIPTNTPLPTNTSPPTSTPTGPAPRYCVESAATPTPTSFIHELQSLSWETYPGNDALDTANGSVRIFPDRAYLDQSQDRRKVNIKGQLNVSQSNITVYIKVFDVDDPSACGLPIDSNDNGYNVGDDNFGADDFTSTATGVTNSQGEVTVTILVSLQPGDNFVALACCDNNILASVTQKDVDIDVLPNLVKKTDMLTVWRRLHVELDSMEAVVTTGTESNQDVGTISSMEYIGGGIATKLYLSNCFPSEFGDEDQFVNPTHGTIEINNVTYNVTQQSDNSRIGCNSGWDDWVVVAGQLSQQLIGASYVLKDDDDFSILPATIGLGGMEATYDKAFIKPVLESSLTDNDVSFDRNITAELDIRNLNLQRYNLGYITDDFWGVYAICAYQGSSEEGTNADNDGYNNGDYESSMIMCHS